MPEFKILEEDLSKLNHKNLGSVIEFSNETWNQKDFFENEFPYIEISEIDTTSGGIQNITYYKKSKAPSRAKMIVRENDIIVSTTRPHRGAITLIDKDDDGFIASTGFAILREPKIKINREYLLSFLRTQLSLKQMLRRSSGGNYPAITSEELKKIIVPLPPLQTQNCIVELMDNAYKIKKQKETDAQQLLDTIDNYVLDELGIKLPELKDEMCYVIWGDDVKNNRCDAYYYQPKFTLAESKLEAVDYPVFSIGELITDLSGGATPKVEGDFYTDIDGVFFLRVQNISMEGIILEDVKFIKREVHEGMLKRSQLNKNDLVYTITGRIGSVVVVPEGFEGNINQHSVRFHLKEKINNININPHYVAIFLNTELSNFLAIRKATGGTRPALDYPALKSLTIPLPSKEIQDKITKEVKARMQKAEQLQKEAKEVLEEAKERVEKVILGEEEI
ncbi:MAG: Type I restriction modification DNA specificity domain protein [Candidatus Argoarchaeum ethanivorans]|uniref:Type I restriction modification DNA specificity domain protein n=1 Tax=Candidatus Argoarchaeum ethanivorans TaxID=2608793 RepID=A0A811T1N9_9EURY|nr:MAG: Type I restriction modification DNA specificity domain protein [Candidatus Argoarchaeum ethanivorans]